MCQVLSITVLLKFKISLLLYFLSDVSILGGTEWPLLEIDSLETEMKVVDSYPQEKVGGSYFVV